MSEQLVRLLIVDDHPFFRQGVSLFLDGVEWVEVVGDAANGKEALNILHYQPVDLVLMDLQMPQINGIETTRQILEQWPTVKVLVLTSFNTWDQVYQALQAGASGYLLKNAKPEQLLAAIRAVAAGGSYLGTHLARELLERVTRDPAEESQGLSPLTEREVDVLKLIGRGLGNKEIAGELFLSVKTVKTHIANIFTKLELSNRTQAAIYAIRHGMV